MMKLLKKIVNRLKQICNDFRMDLKYNSLYLAVIRLINSLTMRGNIFKNINKWSLNKKDEIILNHLYKEYGYVFDKYSEYEDKGIYEKNSIIWVCWLTGENDAPILVKNCINSIRKHSNNHKVILITLDNYSEYIELPDYIVEKYKKGIIGPAHFSDIVRMVLLRDYGGLWLDATIYCTKDLPEEIFKYPFFSCKSNVEESNFISKLKWTSFVLGGFKESLFFSFMVELYFEYWKKSGHIIDYLLIDYIIVLADKNIKGIHYLLENLPVNNLNRDELVSIFNNKFNIEEYLKIVKSETYLYKLSWREKFYEETVDGFDTLYKYFLYEYEYLQELNEEKSLMED